MTDSKRAALEKALLDRANRPDVRPDRADRWLARTDATEPGGPSTEEDDDG